MTARPEPSRGTRRGQRRGALPRPRKRFGQHFLEPTWVAKVIDAIAPRPDERFLEIGPGRGALTKPLAPRVASLVAVEIDRDLAEALSSQLPPPVRIVQGDFLDADLRQILKDERPPILFKLLRDADEGRFLSDATLMLQKEVADRLVATPGTGDYGTLAIQVALFATVTRMLTLPPGAFRPPPKVTSAVVRLNFHTQAEDVGDSRVFERVVRGVFRQRRKTLLNALRPVADSFGRSAAELIERAGVDGRQRPETLTLAEMARLARAVL
jgi:16S rRNA (adenine1518-N6/adenine1519-N6)-dimethyltransferase